MISTIQNVKLKNFMSFGNKEMEFKLDNGEMVLIVGDNRDTGDAGESKNGAGKTTLMNAVVYALYGRGIKKQKADEMINIINEKGMEVTLTFTRDGKTYEIVRGRKPNKLLFTENGVSLTLDAMANTDDLIAEKFGYSFDVFMTMRYLAPSKEPFMGLKPTEQREIMESILSLDTLTKRDQSLKVISGDKEIELKLAQKDHEHAVADAEKVARQVERLQQHHDAYRNKLQENFDVMTRIIEQFGDVDFDAIVTEHENVGKVKADVQDKMNILVEINSRISLTKREIESCKDAIARANTHQQRLDEWDKQRDQRLEEAREELSKTPDENYLASILDLIEERDSLGFKISDLEQKLKDTKRKLKTALDKLPHIDEKISILEAGRCPECDQIHVDKEKIERFKAERDELASAAHDLEAEQIGLQDAIDELQKKFEDANDKVGENTVASITRFVNSIETLEKKIGDIEAEQNPLLGDSFDVEELTATLKKYEHELDDFTEQSENIRNIVTGLKESTELSELAKEYSAAAARDAKREVESAHHEIKAIENDLKSGKSPYFEELEIAKQSNVNPNDLLDKVQELEDDIRHIKYLRKLLTDNKSFIRRNIVNQYIPFVNKKILEYSQKLDLSHVAQINSDLTTDIEYMSRPVSFGSLSAGEQMRVNVATTAAFIDLVSLLGNGCNLMLVDELFDSSLDPGGMHKAFNFVKSITTDVLLISHRPELIGEVDKIVTICKENGFSRIVEA